MRCAGGKMCVGMGGGVGDKLGVERGEGGVGDKMWVGMGIGKAPGWGAWGVRGK